MRVLVTGHKGQLGTELMAVLDPSRHEVLGVDLPEVDLTARDMVLATICEWQPDLVIHAAAFTAVDLCETEVETAHRVNCLATRFVAEGARRVGAHVVYVSTDYVFDGTKPTPYLEWDATNPQSVYGRTKLGGERELDASWTVARTSWVCGYHGANMVKTVLKVARERDELAFVDDQVGHPTFAGDLAPVLVRLGVERAQGVHHVTNQGAVSWYGFVREVLSAAGESPERVRPISTADLDPPRPAQRPANSVLDNFALRHSGFGELRDFREPLGEVVSRLVAEGW